jgi:hypothetical protein
MSLDLVGTVSLVLSVTSLFLLIVGLPLVSNLKSVQNLQRHGYLTIAALALETILVFLVMVPSFLDNLPAVFGLPISQALNTWLHVGLGVFAEVAGFAYVALWLAYSRSRMMCLKAKRLMTPTFLIWIIVIITGAIIHLLEFF